jgi:hypothetical protein
MKTFAHFKKLFLISAIVLLARTDPFQKIGFQPPSIDESIETPIWEAESLKQKLSKEYQALVKRIFKKDVDIEDSILRVRHTTGIPQNDDNKQNSRSLLQKAQSSLGEPAKTSGNHLEQTMTNISTDSGTNRSSFEFEENTTGVLPSFRDESLTPKVENLKSRTPSFENIIKNPKNLVNSFKFPQDSKSSLPLLNTNSVGSPSLSPMDMRTVNLHFDSATKKSLDNNRLKDPNQRKTTSTQLFNTNSNLNIDSTEVERSFHENKRLSVDKSLQNLIKRPLYTGDSRNMKNIKEIYENRPRSSFPKIISALNVINNNRKEASQGRKQDEAAYTPNPKGYRMTLDDRLSTGGLKKQNSTDLLVSTPHPKEDDFKTEDKNRFYAKLHNILNSPHNTRATITRH